MPHGHRLSLSRPLCGPRISPIPQRALPMVEARRAKGRHFSGPFALVRLRVASERDGRSEPRRKARPGGMFQYQIKSEIDGHVRMVREIQLADLGS
jgi:hypothetical protein